MREYAQRWVAACRRGETPSGDSLRILLRSPIITQAEKDTFIKLWIGEQA